MSAQLLVSFLTLLEHICPLHILIELCLSSCISNIVSLHHRVSVVGLAALKFELSPGVRLQTFAVLLLTLLFEFSFACIQFQNHCYFYEYFVCFCAELH